MEELTQEEWDFVIEEQFRDCFSLTEKLSDEVMKKVQKAMIKAVMEFKFYNDEWNTDSGVQQVPRD